MYTSELEEDDGKSLYLQKIRELKSGKCMAIWRRRLHRAERANMAKTLQEVRAEAQTQKDETAKRECATWHARTHVCSRGGCEKR
jgi:hypothetical protein